MLKIATWNLERPTKTTNRKKLFIEELGKIDADIIILTESNEYIQLGGNYFCHHSSALSQPYYKNGERRVSIYSRFECIGSFPTFSEDTAICKLLRTPDGDIAVYATVIGIHGNRRNSFREDLSKQLEDFYRISSAAPLCIAGDFNISFSDNYYYTRSGRELLNACFKELELENLTANLPCNIDHIVLSKQFMHDKRYETASWNEDKRLSDHKYSGYHLLGWRPAVLFSATLPQL